MTFGGQVVTFVAVTQTESPGYLGVTGETRTETPVTGCHFRPAQTSEAHGDTTTASGLWKATCPPVAAAVNATPGAEVKCGGLTFLIEGFPMVKRDIDGSDHHVTVMCRRQVT